MNTTRSAGPARLCTVGFPVRICFELLKDMLEESDFVWCSGRAAIGKRRGSTLTGTCAAPDAE